MSDLEETRVLRVSSLYRTEPFGMEDQDWFVNAAAEIRTLLPPRRLLEALLHIEDAMGRTREKRWGPRVIDLDLLFYGQSILSEPGLTIPHPELHKRRFVLVPMTEIAPYFIHPVYGISMSGLLDRLTRDKETVELLGEAVVPFHR